MDVASAERYMTLEGVISNLFLKAQRDTWAMVRGHRMRARSACHMGIPNLYLTSATTGATHRPPFYSEVPTLTNTSSSGNIWKKTLWWSHGYSLRTFTQTVTGG